MKTVEINDLTQAEQDALVSLAKQSVIVSPHAALASLSRSIAAPGLVTRNEGYKMLMHRTNPHKKLIAIYTVTNEGIDLVIEIQKMRNREYLS